MNPERKTLPIGIESFEKIRQGNFYYVDKTPFALSLAQEAGYYFLSRPRRFGKSLFVDTLKELFEGNQALFVGLDIHDKWDWTQRFPVIHISFAAGELKSRAELDRRIRTILRLNLERLGLDVDPAEDIVDCFERLIHQAASRHGQRVVILVDEYDKPILDNILDRETASAMREGLRNLYSVIKGADAHIRFVFLTGVSKFSKASLFSGLNNLRDITLYEPYSAICGYTDFDVDTVFADQLPGLDREQIRRWYNGYNWTGAAVYNPFDLLLLFMERKFGTWWCNTGTPGFLFKLMQQEGFFSPALAKLCAGEELISAMDVDEMTPQALLFQTGYLTIHQIGQALSGETNFMLGYPNKEVELSLNKSLLKAYTGSAVKSEAHRQSLAALLAANDVTGMRALFQSFFAGSPDRSIPHQWYTDNAIAQYEGFYASVFYSYFAALGLNTQVEDATNLGRIDMSLQVARQIWLFEFKVVEATPSGRALQQIKDKGYADKYRARGLPIHLVGVEFSKEQRNVVGFEVETLAPTASAES